MTLLIIEKIDAVGDATVTPTTATTTDIADVHDFDNDRSGDNEKASDTNDIKYGEDIGDGDADTIDQDNDDIDDEMLMTLISNLGQISAKRIFCISKRLPINIIGNLTTEFGRRTIKGLL
ncbi:uncharacterized protein LOC106873023 [Octopus bimaculoides]|uniref:uncharacterized protein LOC106873023 n=1 Tax=Octopus bimaculoides TaxID=37653 RepID=UPI00071C8F8D|nr:uncharacterized protein LOC106873023 [Octopus bimaculoides]|eukprot:XP_014775713.1 PREDICTED: uncharacterized protein LOC106873023 [Octopus bimaculoides]